MRSSLNKGLGFVGAALPSEWGGRGLVVYTALVPSALAFLGWNQAQKSISPGLLALTAYAIPLASALFALLLLGKTLTFWQPAGAGDRDRRRADRPGSGRLLPRPVPDRENAAGGIMNDMDDDSLFAANVSRPLPTACVRTPSTRSSGRIICSARAPRCGA